jgi:hypothetical protein
VIGPELDRADRAVDVRLRGGHDDLDQRKVFADDLQEVDAAEPGLRDVGDEDVDVLLVEERQARLGRRRADDAVVASQCLRQTLARVILPVDNQNSLASCRHRRKYTGMALWIVAVIALVVALAALAQARRTARQLAQVTEMYWQLKFDHGELKAKLDPPVPVPPAPKQTFVPLSSVKKP